MTDNNRSPDRSIEPNNQSQDPLLELTQLFDFNSDELDYSSLNQTVAPNNGGASTVANSEHDELDLSFMDDTFSDHTDDTIIDDSTPNNTIADNGSIVGNGQALPDDTAFASNASFANGMPMANNGLANNDSILANNATLPNNPAPSPQAFSNQDLDSAETQQANSFFNDDTQNNSINNNSSFANNSSTATFANNSSTATVASNPAWQNGQDEELDMPSFLQPNDADDEMAFLQQNDYDTELEDLLAPEPISTLNSAPAARAASFTPSRNTYAVDNRTTHNQVGANNVPPMGNNDFYEEPATGFNNNASTYPEQYAPHSNGSYVRDNSTDPFDDLQNNYAMVHSEPTHEDPFGLEDLSNDEQLIPNSQPIEEADYSTAPQGNYSNEQYGNQYYDEANNGQYYNHANNSQYGEDNYTTATNNAATDHSHGKAEHSYAQAEHNDEINHQGIYPPDVDTYKFSDEIVETTETIDLPDIPYQEQETKPVTDPIKDDFSDIFNVGMSNPVAQEPLNEETFYYNGYAQKNPTEQQQDFNDDDEFYHNSQYDNYDDNDFPTGENNYEEDDNYDFANPATNVGAGIGAAALASSPYAEKRIPFIKKAAFAAGGLVVILGVVFAATHYFLPQPESNQPTVIQADNTPFKIPANNTQTTNNRNNSEDVYNLVSGSETIPEPKQDVLIDGSETPEDITAINEQAPQNNGAYVNPTTMQDAITAATNQAVPVREVQTVVVNPDGTVLPGPTQIIESQNTQSQNTQSQASAPTGVSNNSGSATTQQNDITDIASIINGDTTTYRDNTAPAANNGQQAQTRPVAASPAANQTTMPVTANTYYVQLSSHPTQDLAKIALNRSKQQLGSLIGGLPLTIQSANIPGKGIYYRVRVQTSSRDDAVNLCEQIKSANASCFISR